MWTFQHSLKIITLTRVCIVKFVVSLLKFSWRNKSGLILALKNKEQNIDLKELGLKKSNNKPWKKYNFSSVPNQEIQNGLDMANFHLVQKWFTFQWYDEKNMDHSLGTVANPETRCKSNHENVKFKHFAGGGGLGSIIPPGSATEVNAFTKDVNILFLKSWQLFHIFSFSLKWPYLILNAWKPFPSIETVLRQSSNDTLLHFPFRMFLISLRVRHFNTPPYLLYTHETSSLQSNKAIKSHLNSVLPFQKLKLLYIFALGVLVLLNRVPILVRLDCFSHSITMEALTPAQCKTVKIHRIQHTPVSSFTFCF